MKNILVDCKGRKWYRTSSTEVYTNKEYNIRLFHKDLVVLLGPLTPYTPRYTIKGTGKWGNMSAFKVAGIFIMDYEHNQNYVPYTWDDLASADAIRAALRIIGYTVETVEVA